MGKQNKMNGNGGMKRVALIVRFYRRSNNAQIHILTRNHSEVETLNLAENPAETGPRIAGRVKLRLHFSVKITAAGKFLGWCRSIGRFKTDGQNDSIESGI